ncbi:MAG: hypothetical protein FD123_3720 [Bacteroidetes bacterium]|nr:MAG: hypothetical protein FD123_3720 [Bacteroidota bacterium]
MSLQETSATIMKQIIGVVDQLGETGFSKPLSVLNGNTIGKHVRHIVEFYDCLVRGYCGGIVNYDERKRDQLLETDKKQAVGTMKRIVLILELFEDKPLELRASYADNGEIISGTSSFNRELVYNIEHAIHHMAIIAIALRSDFPLVSIPENFGVAYSTTRYTQAACAQ